MFRVLMTGGCGNHLKVLHTSVDLPGESVLIRAVIGYLSCVCVFILSPQGNRVFFSQIWVRMY